MPPPLAYFLTWTVRGTWLHGDPRGSVDKRHNARDTPLLAADSARHTEMSKRVRENPKLLGSSARSLVEDTIREHCHRRGWRLAAVNARSNHVHAVVSCDAHTRPEDAMAQFKAWCTRRLREAGHIDSGTKLWTQHGSTRWINDLSSLNTAIDYVLNHQDIPRRAPNERA